MKILESAESRTLPLFLCACGGEGLEPTRAGAWCLCHARRPLAKCVWPPGPRKHEYTRTKEARK